MGTRSARGRAASRSIRKANPKVTHHALRTTQFAFQAITIFWYLFTASSLNFDVLSTAKKRY